MFTVVVAETQALQRAKQAHPHVRPGPGAVVDRVNSSMFFGDPFTVVVRDDASAEEMKALLTGPGVLYVREDEPLPAAPPNAHTPTRA